MITNKQTKQIENVVGRNFEESDIPAFMRSNDEDYPLGHHIEEYDAERERKMITDIEEANEIEKEQIHFLNDRFGIK